jgi:hypothetical protein
MAKFTLYIWTLIQQTHFEGNVYLQEAGNPANIHTVQRHKKIILSPEPRRALDIISYGFNSSRVNDINRFHTISA